MKHEVQRADKRDIDHYIQFVEAQGLAHTPAQNAPPRRKNVAGHYIQDIPAFTPGSITLSEVFTRTAQRDPDANAGDPLNSSDYFNWHDTMMEGRSCPDCGQEMTWDGGEEFICENCALAVNAQGDIRSLEEPSESPEEEPFSLEGLSAPPETEEMGDEEAILNSLPDMAVAFQKPVGKLIIGGKVYTPQTLQAAQKARAAEARSGRFKR